MDVKVAASSALEFFGRDELSSVLMVCQEHTKTGEQVVQACAAAWCVYLIIDQLNRQGDPSTRVQALKEQLSPLLVLLANKGFDAPYDELGRALRVVA